MPLRRAGRDSPVWVALGTGVSGLATYALLVVVARAVSPVAYSDFSFFWTFVVVVSLGVFLPVEQLTARQISRRLVLGTSSAPAFRQAVRTGGVAAVVVLAVLAVAVGRLGVQDAGAVVTATVAAVAGFVVQFAARGVLAGHRQLRGYAVVLCVDAGGRALAACVLWAAGVTSAVLYMVAVSASSVACALVGAVLARRAAARAAGGADLPTAGGALRGRETVVLVVAASCMQLLLNSGVLAAGAAEDAAPALAGLVLAVLTLVRLPVFVVQAAQAAYVARIAGLHQAGDARGLRRLLLLLAGLVTGVGALTVLGAAVAGPWLVPLLFGEGYDASRTLCVVAGGGIALYLVASVLNDVAVALGAHRAIAVAWPAGVAAAVAVHVLPSDVVLAATLPLLAGAAAAALVLLPAVLRHARVVHPPTPAAPAPRRDTQEAPGA